MKLGCGIHAPRPCSVGYKPCTVTVRSFTNASFDGPDSLHGAVSLFNDPKHTPTSPEIHQYVLGLRKVRGVGPQFTCQLSEAVAGCGNVWLSPRLISRSLWKGSTSKTCARSSEWSVVEAVRLGRLWEVRWSYLIAKANCDMAIVTAFKERGSRSKESSDACV
jgi:hypothetical protein